MKKSAKNLSSKPVADSENRRRWRVPDKVGRLFRFSALVAVGQVGASAATLLQSVFLARSLGPEMFGVWALILGAYAMVTAFASFRTAESLTAFWMTVPKEASEDEANRPSLFYASVYIELLTKLAAVAIGSTLLSIFFKLKGYDSSAGIFPILLVGAARFLEFLDPVWITVVRASRFMTLFASKPALVAWSNLIAIVIGVSFFSPNLTTVALAFLASAAVLTVVRFVTLRLAGWRWATDFMSPVSVLRRRHSLAAYWSLMRAGYVTSCLSSIIKEIDLLIVGLIGTAIQASYYRIAKSLAVMVQLFSNTMRSVIIQDFVEVVRDRRLKRLGQFVRREGVLYGALVVALGGISVPLIDPITLTLYGSEFSGVRTPFLLLLPGVTFAAALFWAQPLAFALRMSRELVIVHLLNFIVFLIALGLGLLLIGVWGVALALSCAFIFGSSMMLVSVMRRLAEEDASGT